MTEPTILCIEDDPDMIDYVKLILGKAGYQVIGAEGGAEGLEMMRNERPDLILLDLMMPGMDGADVLLEKKKDERIRDIPVIALTALDSPFDQIMWLARTDLDDFIVKSKLPRRELIARIERVLQTRSRRAAEMAETKGERGE
ncbi:MAG TPA: response regulator [Anaerolineae bacterium]|jgi:DNA-binding response OmpR family regulator|nr:response regulator [Anaerolineae bacterium]